MNANNSDGNKLISYMQLRRLVGYLGVLLPFVLGLGLYALGCEGIEPSISDYYHTMMRNIFVGTLCAVAVFMFTYKGHDRKDAMAGNLAGTFALGVAFFPTGVAGDCLTEAAKHTTYASWVSWVHFISAFLFFAVLIYFSLVLFTKSNIPKNEIKKGTPKWKRNRTFKHCGYVMIACIVLIALYFFVLEDKIPELANFDPVFWLESIALLAFGSSWLTKGQQFFKDE